MSSIAVKGADTGTGVFTIESPATNTDRILTLPDEAGEILINGTTSNVGIGTSSPSAELTIEADTPEIRLVDNLTTTNYAAITNVDGRLVLQSDDGNAQANSTIEFQVDGSERMRIDASGSLFVNLVSAPTAGSAGTQIVNTGYIRTARDSASQRTHHEFINTNGIVGNITTLNSSTAYNTSSDYRLKEDWQPVANAITDVKALKPCNFAWKADGTRVNGFLAHELAEVIPEAVTGEKDAVDDEGNPVYQGIDQSKLVPLLTAALQEAIGRIETLEARVATLEGGEA